MNEKYVRENYNRILYKANDGCWYHLNKIYPFIFEIDKCLQDEECSIFLLDTGGEMSWCMFFNAKIIGGKLLRQSDKGRWVEYLDIKFL